MNPHTKTSDTSGGKRKKFWRAIKIALLIIVAFIVLALIFVGEIAEYYIEKNDMKYIGRRVELADLDVNILFGTVRIDGLHLYEANGTDDFIAVRGVFADIKPWQLVKKKLIVEEAGIDRLIANISHTNSKFNYDDLLDRFTRADSTAKPETTDTLAQISWDWDLFDIHVDSCRVNYSNKVLETTITVDPFNLFSPRISSSLDTFSLRSDLGFIRGGTIDLNVLTDLAKERYALDLEMQDVAIRYLYHYLRDYLNIEDFGGVLTLDVEADGSIREVQDVVVTSVLEIEDLHVIDMDPDTVFAIDNFRIDIRQADHKNDIYLIDHILVDGPYLKFELYPEGDNLSRLPKFEIAGDTVESVDDFSLPGREYFNVFVYLADYANLLVESYAQSDYKIDSILLRNGRIRYRDHTLNQSARFDLDNISLTALSFDTDANRARFEVSSDINKVGHFDALWAFDPKNVLEMELEMTTTNFIVSSVSPYSFYHTAYPFTHGDALYEGTLDIHDRQIQSENRLFIEDIQVGKKGFGDPPVRLPVRLAVSILRDVDGNIDLEVPVTGDLDDPKFKYWKAVWQVLVNNLEKLVTAPYRLFATMFSVDEDDLREIPWLFGQTGLEKEQRKRGQSIAKVLAAKPELALMYTPVNNLAMESEYLAVFESKSRFYRQEILKKPGVTLTSADTAEIASIANRDSTFYSFLRSKTGADDLASTQEMSIMLVGKDTVYNNVAARQSMRQEAFIQLMTADHQIAPTRIQFVPADSLDTPPDTFNLSGPYFLLRYGLDESQDSALIQQPVGSDLQDN